MRTAPLSPLLGALFCAGLGLLGGGPASAHLEIERQVEELSRRIAADPRDASLFMKRGELHRVHGDLDLALADFGTARALAPELPALDLCVGRTHLEAGRPAQALPFLDRFLSRSPEHVECRVFRARALAALERRLEAACEYAGAIRSCPEASPPRPEYYLERAHVLLAEGGEHREEALETLDEGLARLGPVPVLDLLAMNLEAQRGNYPGALERLERAWEDSPRRESFLWRKGRILEQSGRPQEACLAYEASLEALGALPRGRRSSGAMNELEASLLARLDELRRGVR